MPKQILVPSTGKLKPQAYPGREPGDPALIFDIEIPVRFNLTSPVDAELFPGRGPVAQVSLEAVDLGVSDWRDLAGKDIDMEGNFEPSDASIYLGGVHNQVLLHRIRFGKPRGQKIRADIDLELDFRCVNPRPRELKPSLRVHWEIDLKVISEDEDEDE